MSEEGISEVANIYNQLQSLSYALVTHGIMLWNLSAMSRLLI